MYSIYMYMNGLVHSRLHMYIYINYKVLYVHVHVNVYMYVRTKSLTKKSYTCVIYGENDIHNICVDTEQHTTKGLHFFPLSSLCSGVCYAHMYMYIVYAYMYVQCTCTGIINPCKTSDQIHPKKVVIKKL